MTTPVSNDAISVVKRANDKERDAICTSAAKHYERTGHGAAFTPSLGIEPKSAPKVLSPGKYRVIHGRIWLPRPLEERLLPDGSEDPHVPKQIFAAMGDIVQLTSEDATRMMADGVIEELDANPSKVGVVWAPPKPVRHFGSSAR